MVSDKSKKFLGLTPSLAILIGGHIFLIFGISLIVSEWHTDRMLHKQLSDFEQLISVLNSSGLEGITSKLTDLAERSSAFQLLGLGFFLPGLVSIIVGCFTTRFDVKSLKKLPETQLPVFRLSKDSIILIFSSLFALGLIFVSIGEQNMSDMGQIFSLLILQSEENVKIKEKTVLLMVEIIKRTTFEYGFNVINAVYFSQLGMTFLIAYILRNVESKTRILFHNHLIIMGTTSFIVWLTVYILVMVGITSPSTLSDIKIPSPLDSK